MAVQLLQTEAQRSGDDECGVAALASTQFGGFVVKALLSLGGDVEREARAQLDALASSCLENRGTSKTHKFSEKLLKELGLLFEGEEPSAVSEAPAPAPVVRDRDAVPSVHRRSNKNKARRPTTE
eukprot:gb/GFBE01026864.1/.p1 GENE.gb/GFBE01026864.1/~~gb/GFBE01026864.1/.p1  ORF type:complete len:125 (+),score=29.35 gb/GFBE01026864.1/:1-375(+)